ncbi:MAG: Chemotaxis protein methyltransferase CheR, partial [Myxococcaceae bacterium]|nr:Chemotaxis protein methyltransferase CheR [Myxococcaceae bacterium]
TLDVWSSEGEGSRFSFMLPVAFAAQEAGAHLGAMEHARPSRPEHASGFSGAPLGGVGDDFLTGGGEMGKLIRALDWDETPLGPTSSWPQSLRTTVSLCLAAHLPTSITWGPKHVQIYNDGYSRFCGGKHPHALGQSFSECWASAWPAVGPAFERALEGETQYLENVRMFLDRHGDLEETFFSFSNSPLRDESGGIGGLFHQVTENTASVLSERRTRVLRDLAARLGKAYTLDAVYAQTAGTLAEAALDVPFMLLYALEGRTLRLVARTALPADCAAAPPWLELDATMPWPLAEVLHSGVSAQLDDVGERLQGECCGPYPELPRSALAIPIKPAGAESAALCLVLGLSARLPKSAAYLDFLELLASTLSASVSGARAGEVERTRGESQQLAERARMQLAMAQMPKPTLGQQTRQAELEQALRARDEFLIVVSHELRTPVAALAMQLETLSPRRIAELSAEALRTRSEALVQRMKRLTRQVNELVVVAKLITEHVPLSRAPTDLSELVSAAVEELREEALRLHCSVTVQSSQHLVGGFDRGRLLQAFVNLLDNALKFGAGKPVDVRVVGEPGHAVVSFVDRGQGVTAADEERIFQRFQRAVSSSHYGGFGLGLWTVQQIVQAHEGSVRVAHTAGGGATFEVRLPLS